MKYRPLSAFKCVYVQYFKTKELDRDRAIRALLASCTSEENVNTTDTFQIIEIIKLLQVDPKTKPEDNQLIQGAYIGLIQPEHLNVSLQKIGD